MFSPGIEPGTFCVLDRCDNRYTTKTHGSWSYKFKGLTIFVHYFQVRILTGILEKFPVVYFSDKIPMKKLKHNNNKVSVFCALYFILLRFIYGRYDLLQLSDWNYVRAADGNGILLINAAGSV